MAAPRWPPTAVSSGPPTENQRGVDTTKGKIITHDILALDVPGCAGDVIQIRTLLIHRRQIYRVVETVAVEAVVGAVGVECDGENAASSSMTDCQIRSCFPNRWYLKSGLSTVF